MTASHLHVTRGSVTMYSGGDTKAYTNDVEFVPAGSVEPLSVTWGGPARAGNVPVLVYYDPRDPRGTATASSPAGQQARGYLYRVLAVLCLLAAGALVYWYFFA